MSNGYIDGIVYVLMESEMHEGTYLRGIFTDRYSAEEAMKRLELEEERDNNRSNPDVFSFWIDTHYLNQIIRD